MFGLKHGIWAIWGVSLILMASCGGDGSVNVPASGEDADEQADSGKEKDVDTAKKDKEKDSGKADSGKEDSGKKSEDDSLTADADGDGLNGEEEKKFGTDPSKEDTDGDGLSDSEEISRGTDPLKADTDGDDLNDGDEVTKGTDPSKADTDGDGLNDGDEVTKGMDPLKSDTDGDGLSDSDEITKGTDPLQADTDGDGLNDGDEITKGTEPLKRDTDGDGLNDGDEVTKGTDPHNGDTDGDGANDLVESLVGTDPLNAADNPASHHKTVFFAPYGEEISPKSATLSFVPVVQKIDLYFLGNLQDNTMSGERQPIDELAKLVCADSGIQCQSNADCADYNNGASICSEGGKCIAQSTAKAPCFADMWTGLGWYDALNTYTNMLSPQPDLEKTKSVYDTFKTSRCQDYVHSAACALTGSKDCTNANINCYSGNDRVGCAGYRPDAIKGLILSATKTSSVGWNSKKDKRLEAAQILLDNNVRIMGFSAANCSCGNGVGQLVCYAHGCDSNQVCLPDCSVISMTKYCGLETEKGIMYLNGAYSFNGKRKPSYQELITRTATGRVIDIEPRVKDILMEPSKLIRGLNVNQSGQTILSRKCSKLSNPVSQDAFQKISGLAPGTEICYDVLPQEKQTVIPATKEPQLLEARIQVTAENSVLNSESVYFVVPPALE